MECPARKALEAHEKALAERCNDKDPETIQRLKDFQELLHIYEEKQRREGQQ